MHFYSIHKKQFSLANQIDDSLGRLVLPPLRVDVDELDLDVRQETGAVVDPLDGVAQGPRYGPTLPVKNRCLWAIVKLTGPTKC